ncbi:MAG: N-6 DNA methylase [Neisseriaceae bacterium]|nr:N-6 DNA methylase [Neisseriaceae bacterium]
MTNEQNCNTNKLEYEEKNGKIKALLEKDKWLVKKPEEEVRQKFIARLCNEYGYFPEQMEQEKNVSSKSKRGTGKAQADIVIWKSAKDKQEKKHAFMVVELKQEAINLKVEDFFQGANYASWCHAKIFIISNGKNIKVFRTHDEKLPTEFSEIAEIPHASMLHNEKQLNEFLIKTREFKGDEFANTLNACHDIIRNTDKLDPAEAFDEISKILFLKIMYERVPDDDYLIFSKEKVEKDMKQYENEIERKETSQTYIERKFNGVKNSFKEDKIFEDEDKIKISQTAFIRIVEKLQAYNLTATNEDIKGIAFENFLGKTFRGNLGQYFTPRTIVNFIVELLDPKFGDLVCVPAGGSGGFLIKTFEHIKEKVLKENAQLKNDKKIELFGHFELLSEEEEQALSKEDKKTYEQQKEEYNKKFQEKSSEYEDFINQINEQEKQQIEQLSHKSIFGIDANPRMARVSKMNMIMHGDGHNGVHHHTDGLLNINGIKENKFDFVITNPPFGMTYSTNDESQKTIRDKFDVGDTTGEVANLFIERCINLLKPGGKLGMVLPEGSLNNSNLKKMREIIESKAKIILVVSLPDEVFKNAGANVKTSLLFLQKFSEKEQEIYHSTKTALETIHKEQFQKEINNIDKLLSIRGKKSLPKEEKKILRERKKEIEKIIEENTLNDLKKELNYDIPMAKINKAGITATGTECENELIDLLHSFREYQQV